MLRYMSIIRGAAKWWFQSKAIRHVGMVTLIMVLVVVTTDMLINLKRLTIG